MLAIAARTMASLRRFMGLRSMKHRLRSAYPSHSGICAKGHKMALAASSAMQSHETVSAMTWAWA